MRPVFAAISYLHLFYICIAILVGWWIIMRIRRTAGIWKLRYYAFPRPWLKYLHQDVPFYSALPLELRALYQDKVLQFVDAKLFRPGGKMEEITWQQQLPIAGNACLLLLNKGNALAFPRILTVHVHDHLDPNAEPRHNCVTLLWDESTRRATDLRDRDRAPLLPIATELGWESAGKPALPDSLLVAPWARVRAEEFEAACPGRLAAISSSDPQDVFAVATEMFLAEPARLQQRHPEFYNDLRLFYRIDPARWPGKSNR